MTWTETKRPSDINNQVYDYIVSQFKGIYPNHIDEFGNIRFYCPDGSSFNVFDLGFGEYGSFVLSYFDGDVDGEDGDLYYPEDYDTPEAMFAEMLEETRR